MMNALFLQIQNPPLALAHSLSLYFPDKEDARAVKEQYNDITVHSDLPEGPFLSGNMAFKEGVDALIVANNLQTEINKYLGQIGKQSFLNVQSRYHDEVIYKKPEFKLKWIK